MLDTVPTSSRPPKLYEQNIILIMYGYLTVAENPKHFIYYNDLGSFI